ncbi:glycoside hydrolase family 2 TIM barrel-domain containing protein [Balneolales bacterium ANBcel1]|nr:glycoside hydrolase family 2 TIM barrel-domain containing protein [Balneolales bacterium ANBcel1]
MTHLLPRFLILLLSLAATTLPSLPVQAQEKHPGRVHLSQLPAWQNPEIFGINKEPGRAHAMPYGTIEEALDDDGDFYNSKYHRSLNGYWKFHLADNPFAASPDFHEPGFSDSNWDRIAVPSYWQTEGYGQAIYLNSIYPIDSIMGGLFPPMVPVENNPTGLYRHRFDLPADWDGREVFIRFDGVRSGFYLWINGEKVGYSQGSMTPAEFNITPHLQPGENSIAAKVIRWTDGKWLEDQDMWRMSGIFRDVHLYSTPQMYLQDFFVNAGLDTDYRHGVLEVTTKVRNNSGAVRYPANVEVYLFDGRNNPVGQGPLAEAYTEDPMPPGTMAVARMRTTVENAKHWSAETPYLYTVVLALRDSDGELLQTVRTRAGFRTYEIRDGVFLVNGEEVRLKGANLHEHDPHKAHTVDPDWIRKDYRLMKQSNMNAVRMAHYPHSRHYYELADKYGLYVMDEANVETHGISFRRNLIPGSDPMWTMATLERMRRMVEIHKNYPSVAIWSLGNEAGHGDNFSKSAALIRSMDPSRPIHYQHMNEIADMDSYMYPPPGSVRDILATMPSNRALILCEMAHSMGNSTGNMMEYMELLENHRNYIGTFIWDWVDQGLYEEDEQGNMFWAYGGDYGDYPNDGNFNINGLVMPDRTPQPALKQVKYAYQHVTISAADLRNGTVSLTNRYSHIALDRFYLHWELKEDGIVLQSGQKELSGIEPGERVTVTPDFEKPELRPGREYWLNVSLHLNADEAWADAGHRIAWEQFALPWPTPPALRQKPGDMATPAVTMDGDSFVLQSDDTRIRISRESGEMTSLRHNGRELLVGPLKLNFWRAPTDNDMAGWGDVLDPWKTAFAERSVDRVEIVSQTDAAIAILAEGRLSVGSSTFQTLYTFWGNGVMQVEAHIHPLGDVPEAIPRIGMELRIPADYHTMTWYGRGPEENYQDRNRGINIGEYTGSIPELVTHYVMPQENANRTDVRWTGFTNDEGQGLLAAGMQELNVSAWPYSLQDLEKATHVNRLPVRDFFTVNIDYKQQGVGGINSWTELARAMEPYRLPASRPYSYGFYLIPLDPSSGDMRDLARTLPPKSLDQLPVQGDH